MSVPRVLLSTIIAVSMTWIGRALAPVPLSSATVAATPAPFSNALKCDLTQYKAAAGLTATLLQDLLVVSWSGQGGNDLRARYAIDGGQPALRDLAIRKPGGQWRILGQNLTPEYHVTSGVRRMSEQQAQPLRDAGVELTPEVIEKNRWYAFWDAPFIVPGIQEARGTVGQAQRSQLADEPAGRVLGLPRKPEEIRRATAAFNATSCAVK